MKRVAVALVVAAAGCSFEKTLDGDAMQAHGHDGAWLDGFAQREQIVLAAGDVTRAALPHFVASVTGAADAVRAGGAQIAFTGEDGKTPLPAEILAFDPATGAFDAWIATTLATGRDTHVYVYFDGALAVAPSNDPVWDPTIFAGAWHMEADAQMAAIDSVAGNTAIAADLVPGVAPGMAGNARSYDGDTLVAADSPAYHFDVAHSFAFAIWVNTSRSNGDYDIPFHKGGSSSDSHGFDFELGLGGWVGTVVDDNDLVTHSGLGQEATLGGAWHQLAVAVDREHAQLIPYVDGTAVSNVQTYTGAAFVTGAEPVLLGRTDYPFTGLLDEVRIYTVAPSADWFAAEYANLAQRAAFVTFGAPESR